jgi:hypothetical protein
VTLSSANCPKRVEGLSYSKTACPLERLSKGHLYVLHSYCGLAEDLVRHCDLPIVPSSEYRAKCRALCSQ